MLQISQRIDLFLMNLLVNLAADHKNDNFRGQRYFIIFFETVMKHLEELNALPNSNTCQIAHIQSLKENCLKVLHDIFHCQSFANIYFSESCAKNIRTCIEILKILLQQNDLNQWYLSDESTTNILHNFFNRSSNEGNK